MNPLLIVLIAVCGVVLAVLLVGLYMICPGKKRGEIEKYRHVKFAHRGLHDSAFAENSMSAFAAAKARGFGIELDVRLSKDGELVVFHDDSLKRMTGIDGEVKDYTADELAAMRLGDTADGIPTLRQVLELIDGSVPLLIEMKEKVGDSGVAQKLVEVIEGYRGDFIVESFNPMSLRALRSLRPDILRGILSNEYMKQEENKGKIIYRLAQDLRLNFLMRPDFVAYEKNGYKQHGVRMIRHAFGTPLFAWTVKSLEEEKLAISHGFDTVIFEGYISEK
jgi:glycerophosphoryl diester phosphodiesterase